MRKILLLISFIFIAHISFSQYITAQDDASSSAYNTGFNDGTNGGNGFGPWNNWDEGSNSGNLIGSSATNFGNIDVSGESFGLYGHSGEYAFAQRELLNWSDGATFSVNIAINYRNGNKGITLYDESFNEIFVFNAFNNVYYFGGINLGWGYIANSIFQLNVTQSGSNLYVELTRFGDSYSQTFAGKTLKHFKMFCGSTENGNDENNLYFNSMQVEYSDPAKVPAAADVIINGTVELPAGESLTCNDLTISGGNTFTLKSDGSGKLPPVATPTGSLIVNGTNATGTVTVERYIQNHYGVADEGWHLLASPFTAFTVTGSDFAPDGSEDLYYYDEVTDMWMNWRDGSDAGFDFEAGKGYLCSYNSASETKVYSGTINNADKPFTDLTITAGGNGTPDGWHLLGNPFTSALDWSAGDWNISNISIPQIYSEFDKNYVAVNILSDDETNIIPAMQGFFVQATNSSNSITIPKDARVHNTTPWHKDVYANVNTLKLKFTGSEIESKDLLMIGFTDQTSDEFDILFDSHKLFGMSSVPQFYMSNESGEQFSVNYLSIEETEKDIQINTMIPSEGEYTIRVEENTLESFSNVYLIDNFLNTQINLAEVDSYTFQASSGDNENRFKLHFGATGIAEVQKEALQAYVSGDQLYILGEEGTADLIIYNLQGQELFSKQIELNEQYSQSLDLNTGIYLVRLQTKTAIKTAKVIIK